MSEKATIWKYPLSVQRAVQSFEMPRGAVPVYVHGQHSGPTVWCIVDPTQEEEEKETRNFVVVGTGWDFPDLPGSYVGSCVMGEFVWHVLEVIPNA